MRKLSEKTINYLKLFLTGIILIWLFIRSPFNPLYEDSSSREIMYVVQIFILSCISAFFMLWFIHRSNFVKISEIKSFLLRNRDIDTLLVFIISFVIFLMIFIGSDSENHITTDLEIHAKMILRINYGIALYLTNFLYFLIVNTLSGFSKNLTAVWFSSSVVLALSVAAKYKLSKIIIRKQASCNIACCLGKKTERVTAVAALFLLLYFPVQDYFGHYRIGLYYLGKITPNVWHNSTTIFLIPFSILLFYYQYKIINRKENISADEIVKLSALVFLNLIIKPSFFIVYAPVTTVYLLVKHRLGTEFVKNIIPVLFGSGLLLIMHSFIYLGRIGEIDGHGGGAVVISRPFEAFLYYIPTWYFPIAIVASFAFPVAYMILYREIFKELLFRYAMSLMAFSLLLSFFIIESGPRRIDGNFLWQNVVTYYIFLLLLTGDLVFRLLKGGFTGIKIKIVAVIFSLHIASGLGYIYKLLNYNFH